MDEDNTITLDEILEEGVIVAVSGDVLIRYNRLAHKRGAFSAFQITMYGIVPITQQLISFSQLEQRFSADVACMQDIAKQLADNVSDLLEDEV